jgi:hypothetical protein
MPNCRKSQRSNCLWEAIMHKPTLLMAAALLAAPMAVAAPGPEREGYYIAPYEMLEVLGDYQLSDGGRMRVSQHGRRVFVQMGDGGRVELRPVAPLVFVSSDRRLRLAFTPKAFATDVLITRSG